MYKVRDRRTGRVMARKSITTLEAPMKQLLREIRIISSTKHTNIIAFYGAYISPSIELMLTIVPCRREAMCGMTAFDVRMTAKTFVS